MADPTIIDQIVARQRNMKVKPGVKNVKTPEWLYPMKWQREYISRLIFFTEDVEELYKEVIFTKTENIWRERDLLQGRRVDDGVDNLESIFNTFDASLNPVVDSRIQEIIRGIPEGIEQFNAAQWQKIINAKLGIDLFVNEPWLEPMIKAWNRTNVRLIKNMLEDERKSVETIVFRNYSNGARHTTMIEEIQKAFNTTENRARLIARDQTNKLNGDLMKQRQEDIGITHYFWRDSDDERVRPTHQKFDGQRFPWEKGSPEGNPGQPIQCVPGDTKIYNTYGTKKIYSRKYKGELVNIHTSNGDTLAITPNHPILTSKGWCTPNDINIGDNILYVGLDKTIPFLQNVNDEKVTIEQIFNFLSIIFPTTRITGSSLQFHHDGIEQEEVNIIDIQSFLPSECDQSILQVLFKEFLCISNTVLSKFSLLGKIDQMINTLFISSNGVVSGFCNLFAFLHSASIESDTIRDTDISNGYSHFLESVSNHGSVYVEFFSKFFDTNLLRNIESFNILIREMFSIMSMLSCSEISYFNPPTFDDFDNVVRAFRSTTEEDGSIFEGISFSDKLYKVIDKGIINFDSHVYNLETEVNYYNINGKYIVSNCRCWADPDFSAIDEEIKVA